jgi:hypothetical protein
MRYYEPLSRALEYVKTLVDRGEHSSAAIVKAAQDFGVSIPELATAYNLLSNVGWIKDDEDGQWFHPQKPDWGTFPSALAATIWWNNQS